MVHRVSSLTKTAVAVAALAALTSTPGPELTEQGGKQAQVAADALGGQDFDGVYASTMVRTQQTAQPMAEAVSEPVEVFPGLHEIEAGD
ncbi:histidine phosphatase family protein [Rhodococcus sp. MSC1_016]|jgi:broad specificity phosphatase PhoE|uniref:histidine phosphatase family protein n=1 Tax=Rhodococcus sp. MSC1_016 TaxID=2909266 RepID=UPI00202F348D|nr:histidine phosphatase family protein [Rhodococcus sp. MSC1_016]